MFAVRYSLYNPGCTLNTFCDDHFTPLHLALKMHDKQRICEILKLLVLMMTKEEIEHQTSKDKWTYMHFAAKHDIAYAIKYLHEKR